MFYEEDLELHFWDGEKYNTSKVFNFLKYISKDKKNIIEYKITFINFNLNEKEITEDIYEENRITKTFNSMDIEENNELLYIIKNNFIENIYFQYLDGMENSFHIFYSEGYIYYSYHLKVEDINIKEIFFNIKNIYLELIKIFQPRVSNGGFEVLWEDIYRIKKEKFFEGIYGYLSKEIEFDFLKFEEKIDLGKGYLFLKK